MTDSQTIEAIRASAAAVAAEAAGRAAEVDSRRAYPAESLAAAGREGLMGLLVPAAYGGRGEGLLALATAAEELGGACASTAMCFLMHSCGTALLAAKASPEQGERWLRPAASGAALATLAFSERATGAHFYAPEVSAIRTEGGFRLNGRKHFVTSGGQAAIYPLLVNASGGEGLDIVVVTPDLPGVRFEGEWSGIGMAGNSSISLVLEDIDVPAANLLGAEGDGQDLVFGVVAPTFLVGLGAVNVGIARSALAAAAAHAQERTYGAGGGLSRVPAIQRYLGEMSVAAESARQLVLAAARAADDASPAALPMVMQAKIAATEAAQAVTATAMQVGGGQAYGGGLTFERHWRDARAGSVMAPTNDVLKEWLGRILAGVPLFDEAAA